MKLSSREKVVYPSALAVTLLGWLAVTVFGDIRADIAHNEEQVETMGKQLVGYDRDVQYTREKVEQIDKKVENLPREIIEQLEQRRYYPPPPPPQYPPPTWPEGHPR